jgi:tetratricopeptide (TPR) repeat protein
MNATTQLNALFKLAFAHWDAGRLAEAEAGYAQAIALARDSGLPAVADLHAQLAGVLDAQGRLEEAVAQSELALAAEQVQRGANDAAPSVWIARHFLADRLARNGQAQRALDVLAPSLVVLPDHWLLNLTQAEALWAAGRTTTPGRQPSVRWRMPHRTTSGRSWPSGWCRCCAADRNSQRIRCATSPFR